MLLFSLLLRTLTFSFIFLHLLCAQKESDDQNKIDTKPTRKNQEKELLYFRLFPTHRKIAKKIPIKKNNRKSSQNEPATIVPTDKPEYEHCFESSETIVLPNNTCQNRNVQKSKSSKMRSFRENGDLPFDALGSYQPIVKPRKRRHGNDAYNERPTKLKRCFDAQNQKFHPNGRNYTQFQNEPAQPLHDYFSDRFPHENHARSTFDQWPDQSSSQIVNYGLQSILNQNEREIMFMSERGDKRILCQKVQYQMHIETDIICYPEDSNEPEMFSKKIDEYLLRKRNQAA